jgi:predicted RNase H-like nuclease
MTGRGCGLTRQAWQILPKIREVDTCLTPALQRRVIEAHPELAFMRLAGRPLRAGKKGAAGRRRRARLLQHAFGRAMPATQAVRAVLGRKAVRPDDLLDACVLVLTAQRKLRGKAQRLPPRPPRDRMGLWMEIWF